MHKRLTLILTALLLYTVTFAAAASAEAAVTLPAGTRINQGDGTYLQLNKTLTFDLPLNHAVRKGGEINFTGIQLTLNPGWNLVSFPLIPSNASLRHIIGDDVFFQAVTWSNGAYVSASQAQHGAGYWVFVNEAKTITLSGVPLDKYTADLGTGWHLKAGVLAGSEPGDVFPSQYLTWTGSAYTIPSEIEATKGYWVLCLSPSEVTVQ